MTVDLLIPWRPGCAHREAALDWTTAQYAARHPTFGLQLGECDSDLPFNRSQAIINAAAASSADVFVVSDGDVYCDPTEAIDRVTESGWAVPHALIHRLSAESTAKVLAGDDWRGLPLSTDNAQDKRPYKGNLAGTLFVIRRDVLADVPPDVRFVGWGQEDSAHALALRVLVGRPWRGRDDLVHLWHPPQPRTSRTVGNPVSASLLVRYRKAERSPAAMRALVDEAREAVAA